VFGRFDITETVTVVFRVGLAFDMVAAQLADGAGGVVTAALVGVVTVVVVGGGVVAVVEVSFAANTRGASSPLSGRSTPSLPQVVSLVSETTVPSRHRTLVASHLFTPLPLLQDLEKSRLFEKSAVVAFGEHPWWHDGRHRSRRRHRKGRGGFVLITATAAAARTIDAAIRPPSGAPARRLNLRSVRPPAKCFAGAGSTAESRPGRFCFAQAYASDSLSKPRVRGEFSSSKRTRYID